MCFVSEWIKNQSATAAVLLRKFIVKGKNHK